MAYKLLRGHIYNYEDGLTDRLVRIFSSIKFYNLDYIEKSTSTNMDNAAEVITTLLYNPKAWITQIKLKAILDNDGGHEIKDGTLFNELKKLQKEKIIDNIQIPGTKNNLGYYICTLSAGNRIALPGPSTILDPFYKGQAVKIINPLTGEIEEIGTFKETARIVGKPKSR